MQLGHDLTRFDTLHLHTELLAMCTFRLSRDAPEFTAWKALDRHHVVLPRTVMQLLQEGRAPFVADPVMATLHNPGTPFRREPIADQDDESDYLILSEEAVDEIVGELGVGGRHRARGYRFPVAQTRLPDHAYASALRLFAQASATNASPALWLEEQALALAARSISSASGTPVSPIVAAASVGAVRRLRPDPVARAKRYLAEQLALSPGLVEIARGAHSSPFHLTRLFRRQTGLSLHQYAMTLKVRISLTRLDQYEGRLDRLSQAMGFSDLSHMSRLFHRAFGTSPRAWLRSGANRVDDLDWH